MKISSKRPTTMTAGQINAELDKLDKARSKNTDAMIEAGRGHEKPSETVKLDDPLAREYKAISSRAIDLYSEIAARYGPDAPRRLPVGRGFGPRERP